MKIEGIQRLFGFDNFIIDKITFDPKNVNIEMHRDRRKSMKCPNCQHNMMHNKSIQKQRKNVLVACMDRNASYPEAVRKHCPNAQVVYDKFHIVKNLSDTVDQVRREETNKAEQEKKAIIKGERYNLLRNSENLKPEQRVSLQSLLELNEKINAAYILKEELRLFWSYTYLGSASKFLCNWTMQAVEYELTPLIKFGHGLLRDKREVLASLKTGYTSASIERFNATVSRIIGRGYGYRDLDYLFLKLRQQSVKKHVFHSANLR